MIFSFLFLHLLLVLLPVPLIHLLLPMVHLLIHPIFLHSALLDLLVLLLLVLHLTLSALPVCKRFDLGFFTEFSLVVTLSLDITEEGDTVSFIELLAAEP